MRIKVAELEARRREARADLQALDVDVRKLESQVARIGERVRHVQRFLRWGMGILAALIVSGGTTVIKMLMSGR